MATLTTLTVNLGLNSAQYTGGLNSAEKRTNSALGSITARFDAFGSKLSGIAQIAIGSALGGAISSIGRGILDLGKNAIDAAADMQNLTIALETLLAREIARGDEATVSRQKILHLTDAEKNKLEGLQLKYNTLGARMQEQRERIRQLSDAYGEQGLNVQTAKARLAEMEKQYRDLGGEIGDLAGKEGKLVTVQDKIRINTKSLAEALADAGPAAEKLKGKLRDLSIISPFGYKQVTSAFKFQMAMGATADTAIELTRATLNTGAALGLTGEELDRMSYNLGQALSAGDLTAANLRQLKLVGLDLADVFASDLGMSIEQVRSALDSGKLTMADVSQSFVRYADNNFGNAAERVSKTFSGLKSSIGDVLYFAGSDLLTPALDVATGALTGLFDKAREWTESGILQELGAQLGEKLQGAIDWLAGAGDKIAPFVTGIKELAEGNLDVGLSDFAIGLADLAGELLNLDPQQVQDLGVGIYQIGQKAAEGLEGLASFVEKLGDTAWDTAAKWFADNGEQIKTDLAGIGDSLDRSANALGKLFGQVTENGPEATDILSGVVNTGLGELGTALELINTGLADFTTWLETIKAPAAGAAKESEALTAALDGIQHGLTDSILPFSRLKRQFEDAAALRPQVTKFLNDVTTWFEDLGQTIEDTIPKITKAGEAIVEGLKDGIEKNWESFKTWVGNQIHELVQSVLSALGVGSPARTMIPAGEAMPAGIMVGWRRSFGATRAEIMADLAGLGQAGGGAHSAALGAGALGAGNRGAGDSYTINIYDQAAAALFLERARRARQSRLSAAMGGI